MIQFLLGKLFTQEYSKIPLSNCKLFASTVRCKNSSIQFNYLGWMSGTLVKRQSLTGKRSPSCARPT